MTCTHRDSARGGAGFLLKLIGLCLCAVACAVTGSAQRIIPQANDTRVGGQLIFYFDMVNYDVGYVTITNLGTVNVPLHIQFFGADEIPPVEAGPNSSSAGTPATGRVTRQALLELSAAPVRLSGTCIQILDLRRLQVPGGHTLDLAGIKGFIVVTPVTSDAGRPAIPYNHLTGNAVHARVSRGNSFGLNAVARRAVDQAGNPLADSTEILDGTTRRYENIQPVRLLHDSFFALNDLTDSRIIFLSFRDTYPPNSYLASCIEAEIRGVALTQDGIRVPVANRSMGCALDVSLQEYLGNSGQYFRQTAGSLEISSSYLPNQNLVGISSQTLGSYTVNRYLWGR